MSSEPIGPLRRFQQRLTTLTIVAGGLLMVAGSVLMVIWRLEGGEALGTLWPFYLGGIVALVLGWLNHEQ
jgi:hypothetical protein